MEKTNKELTIEQDNILRILRSKKELQDAYTENTDWFYTEAGEQFAYSYDEVDEALDMLKYYKYVDNTNNITDAGRDYLQNLSIEDTDESLKESKKANTEYKLKIVTGVVTLITTIIGTILAIYSAIKN